MDFRREGENDQDWFTRYVTNEIPIRLICLSNMKFARRSDVLEHFRDQVSGSFDSPSKLVKYAILSHRWLAGGEPTYEHMKSSFRVPSRDPGYQKLKKFCEKARGYGVEFAWADTCCIDKNNSTELDESIRSMFRWYRNSDICIIHLAQSETIEDIADDEWMKRGWTLQELLAPNKIKLFNKRWMPMTRDENDKSTEDTEVMKALGRATRIRLDYLRKFDPGPIKVDERMIWAAWRKTTRLEDVAYSLMGIFNVSLQIAYGEGGDRAFYRLIEAIMQVASDPSVLNVNFVGEAARHHSSSVIPRSPQGFVSVGPSRRLELPQRLDWRLEMTMTSLGLRMRLVILPFRIRSATSDSRRSPRDKSYYEVTLECLLCPSATVKFSDEFIATHRTRQFAFGIVDYSIGSCEVPRIRGTSIGFILSRGPEVGVTICEPRSEDLAGLHIPSPSKREFDPWKKVHSTGLMEINFPSIPSESFFYISREHLKVVYL